MAWPTQPPYPSRWRLSRLFILSACQREGIPLAEATVYLATCPKSNSAYAALDRAIADVRNTSNAPVPLHLRNAVTGLMQTEGYGKGYKYAHDYTDNYVEQEFLPPSLKGRRYYRPSDQGAEQEIERRLARWRDRPKSP